MKKLIRDTMPKANDLSIDGALVRDLAQLLDETGLSEIEYAVGDKRIRVVRAPQPTAVTAVVAPTQPAVAAAPTAPAPEPQAADHPGAVKAPMVGTAYLASQPGAPPFVKTGDTIAEGQVLLIIEAMKVMNQIRATRAGKLTQVLVADGGPVEFGQPLMIIE